jgi:hypothetical protein
MRARGPRRARSSQRRQRRRRRPAAASPALPGTISGGAPAAAAEGKPRRDGPLNAPAWPGVLSVSGPRRILLGRGRGGGGGGVGPAAAAAQPSSSSAPRAMGCRRGPPAAYRMHAVAATGPILAQTTLPPTLTYAPSREPPRSERPGPFAPAMEQHLKLIDGTRIEYDVHGSSGPWVVLLHGGRPARRAPRAAPPPPPAATPLRPRPRSDPIHPGAAARRMERLPPRLRPQRARARGRRLPRARARPPPPRRQRPHAARPPRRAAGGGPAGAAGAAGGGRGRGSGALAAGRRRRPLAAAAAGAGQCERDGPLAAPSPRRRPPRAPRRCRTPPWWAPQWAVP